MQAFAYSKPTSVADAARAMTQEDAKLMAGGQTLLQTMKLGLIAPSAVIDISGMAELSGIKVAAGKLTIGAGTTHAAVAASKEVQSAIPALADLAGHIGDRQVRNRGTIGGSLVHADPAADWPSALTLLGAVAIIAGPQGRRELPIEKFFTGIFETALKASELLVSVRIPRRSKAARYGYWKFCRKAGEFPQAIGGALTDPERKETRTVVGAASGAPRLFLNLDPDLAGIGKDAYSRQLHAVALQRAVEKVLA